VDDFRCLVPGCEGLRKRIGQIEDYVKTAWIVFISSSLHFLRMSGPVFLGMLMRRFSQRFRDGNSVRWSELVSFVRIVSSDVNVSPIGIGTREVAFAVWVGTDVRG